MLDTYENIVPQSGDEKQKFDIRRTAQSSMNL